MKNFDNYHPQDSYDNTKNEWDILKEPDEASVLLELDLDDDLKEAVRNAMKAERGESQNLPTYPSDSLSYKQKPLDMLGYPEGKEFTEINHGTLWSHSSKKLNSEYTQENDGTTAETTTESEYKSKIETLQKAGDNLLRLLDKAIETEE